MQLTHINGQYEILLPPHRAARPEWDIKNGGWEVERIDAMLKCIKSTDIVFDIGTEEGDISALIMKETYCKMVLFEPNNRVWSCIKAIWNDNHLERPLDFFSGFICNETNREFGLEDWDNIETKYLIPDHGFKQLYERYPDVPKEKLDDYCARTGIYPTVITMDVEGSEFEVMKGAEDVLRTHRPIVFMSIHPVFMKEHYNQEVGVMLKFMHDCRYRHKVIELDYHELHVVFEPNKF